MKIEKKLKYTNIYMTMFVLMSMVFTILILFFISLNYINVQKIEHKIVSSLEIQYKQELTQEFYSYFESFLLHIYKNKNFISYLNNQADIDKESITELFKTMAGSNKEITQLRYINKLGKEIIRVDRDNLGDEIYLVEENRLQDKKHRYYFVDTMKKEDGKFDISKLDLNVENNKIMIPHKPVLRFAIPVHSNEKPKGILIVNVFAQKLLNKLLHSQQFNVDIYDEDKQILVSTLNNNWTRYLKTSSHLNTQEFIATQRLIKSKSGESLFIGLTPKQHYNSYGLYFNKYMFLLIVVMIIVSIIAAVYLAKIPQRLLYKLAIKSNTIDKNIKLYRIDKDQIITDVSEAFCKYTRYTKKELIGKNHTIFKDLNTQKNLFEDLLETIKTKKVWHSEMQTIFKDNRECWIDIRIMPEYDENTELVGYIAIIEDITDQKKNITLLEENRRLLEMQQDALIIENELLLDNQYELRQALENFEMFFNTMPIPYIVIGGDLQMRFWNQTAQETFMLKSLLAIEIRPLTIIAKNLSHIDFVNYLYNATAQDKPYKIEMYMEDKSLKYFNVHAIQHPTDINSYILSFNSV